MDEMMLMQFSSSAGSSSSSSSSAAPMNSNPIAAQNFTQLSKFMSTTTTATNNLPPGGLVQQPHPLISPTGAANMNINDLASLGSTIDLNTLSAGKHISSFFLFSTKQHKQMRCEENKNPFIFKLRNSE